MFPLISSFWNNYNLAHILLYLERSLHNCGGAESQCYSCTYSHHQLSSALFRKISNTSHNFYNLSYKNQQSINKLERVQLNIEPSTVFRIFGRVQFIWIRNLKASERNNLSCCLYQNPLQCMIQFFYYNTFKLTLVVSLELQYLFVSYLVQPIFNIVRVCQFLNVKFTV